MNRPAADQGPVWPIPTTPTPGPTGPTPTRKTGEASLEAAYAENHGPLFGHLLAITRDPATAEDLTQEAFLRLTREVQAGRSPDNVPAWLHRVAANLATSRARRARTADRWSTSLLERETGRSPEDEFLRREQNQEMRAALDRLNDTDRAAVLLAAYGYRGPEIARSLARSQTATRTVLCRARSRLRTHLANANFRP